MTGFVVHSESRRGYLQFVPFDGSIAWAGSLADAQVMTSEQAIAVARYLPAHWGLTVIKDYRERAPQPVPAKSSRCVAVVALVRDAGYDDECDEQARIQRELK